MNLAVLDLSDAEYARLRRVQSLSGLVPVSLFLVAHFLSNAVAIAGPAAYDRFAEFLDRLPGVRGFEILVIGLPILIHLGLGIVLGNSGQAIDRRDAYPRPWMADAQRVTGGYLAFYVIFHVWWTRLSPEVLRGDRELFALTRHLLQDPATFVVHALGVVAASAHLGLGLVGAAHYWGVTPDDRGRRRLTRLAWAGFLVMSAIGLNALTAFVSRPARWLEPAAAVATLERAGDRGPNAGVPDPGARPHRSTRGGHDE